MSTAPKLTEDEKTQITVMREQGIAWSVIADKLGRSKGNLCFAFKNGFLSSCKYVCINCGAPTNSEKKLCHARECRNIAQRERARVNYLWYTYKLTPEAHAAILKAQDYKCPICHCELTEENMHTDHNHKTDRVRGITCRKHNNGMGFFDDNPELLRAAADYLEGKTLVTETTNYLAEVSV